MSRKLTRHDYTCGMPAPVEPTINDVLFRLYTIRDTSAASVEQEARALIARQTTKGQLRSGATLKCLASLIESAFDAALVETLAVLRHLRSSAGTDYQAYRDQAFLRARGLVPTNGAAAPSRSGVQELPHYCPTN